MTTHVLDASAQSGALLHKCVACGQPMARTAKNCVKCGGANDYVHPTVELFLEEVERGKFDGMPGFTIWNDGITITGQMPTWVGRYNALWFFCLLAVSAVAFTVSILIGLAVVGVGLWLLHADEDDSFEVKFSSGKMEWTSTSTKRWRPVKEFFEANSHKDYNDG